MTRRIGLRERALLSLAIAFLVGLTVQPLMASTVAVGTCVPTVIRYPTIQAAVTAVKAGSTIEVCPGNYPEQVVINKNLTLNGVTSGTAKNPVVVIPASGFAANTNSLTTSNPIAAQILVTSPATSVTISNLAVDGSDSNLNSGCAEPPLIGIYYQNASGTLRYVAVRNQAQNTANFGCQESAGLGIFVESGNSETSTVSIDHSAVRGYQKNGITADETGTSVTLIDNAVVGAGPVNNAQNGIQIGFGATGRISNNNIADNIFNGSSSEGLGSGILIYDSGDMTVTGNSVTSTQIGIAIVTDGALPANGNTLTDNTIAHTVTGDGIDVCSNNNTLRGNTVFSSSQAGIHLDSSCGSTGNNNTVSSNIINEACAGLLLGSGSGNTFPAGNDFANVNFTTLAGDVCTPTVVSDVLRSDVLRSEQLRSSGHTVIPARP